MSTVTTSGTGRSAVFFDRRLGLAGSTTSTGSTTSAGSKASTGSSRGAACFLVRLAGFGAGSTAVAIAGTARSMLRRAGAKLSTTSVTDSPTFMNSRALRGAGSAISRRGT